MWRRVYIVFAKEVMDNARDRRSLLVALIYPMLGPALLGVMISMVSSVLSAGNSENRMDLHVAGAANGPQLTAYLESRNIAIRPAGGDPELAVKNGQAEVVLIIPDDFSRRFDEKRTAEIKIIADSSRLPGLFALNRLAGVLGEFNRQVWEKRLSVLGVDFMGLRPLDIHSVNVAAGISAIDILMFMVPPLIIFNIFMGGVYLAIDTTSGERERGSLEPLLINPVERWGLMLGKFLAALLFTGVAVAVQLAAFKAIFDMMGSPGSSFVNSLDARAVAGIMVSALPLMMLAVGVQFIIATVTRSFKEAQTYLGLLPLVPAMPGLVLVFSPVEAEGWMMTIPTFSQTLLFGQFVRGEAVSMLNVAISTSATTLVALVLVAIAAGLYEREKLIFGG
ncbi:MAG: ABC transporter permease subunit [Rhodospirillales bacterium]